MNTDLLAGLEVPKHCIENSRSGQENRRSVYFRLPAQWTIRRVSVDGCWIRNEQRKVDTLFYLQSRDQGEHKHAAVLVEFKGGDFGHALTQIESTLVYLAGKQAWRSASSLNKFALVVLSHGRQIPGCQAQLKKIQDRHKVIIRQKCAQITVTDISRDITIQ